MKRALLPFVGTLASKLFGVATDGDLKKVNKGLKRIKESQEEALHIFGDTMSVINKTNQDIQINRKTINQLQKATDLLDTKLETLYNKVIHESTPELHYAQTAIQLHNVYHIHNSVLDSLTVMLTQFSSQMNDLLLGTLPYGLIPPTC